MLSQQPWLHELPAQHGCPGRPQARQYEPAQVEPELHAPPEQHGSPGAPHLTHWFPKQELEGAEQVPVYCCTQQGWPSSPQARQSWVWVSQTWPLAVHRFPLQQGWPDPPQEPPPQEPLLQIPPAP